MSDRSPKSRGLGRGLSALMADIESPSDQLDQPGGQSRQGEYLMAVDRIEPNPDQPRKTFSQDALTELADSIKEKGVLQPLIVRASPRNPDRYEIVAGERRWRAAQLAQLHNVPVIIRSFSDTEVLEIAIIENIQRADLNAIEEATGYRQLMERFGHTQEHLAQALGKSRSHIANLVRLLQLPSEVQGHIREGRLTAGHARALITSHDPSRLASQVIQRGLSVRDTERLAKNPAHQAEAESGKSRSGPDDDKDADTRALEQDLSAQLGMSVKISHLDVSGAGQVTVRYRSLDQLDRLCLLLSAHVPDDSI